MMEFVVQEAAQKVLDGELQRARQLRQKQVRQQASQWSEDRTRRFEQEKLRQKQEMAQQVTEQVQQYAKSRIQHLLTAHDLAVAEVGAAHRAAAKLREAEAEKKQRAEELRIAAQQRGEAARKAMLDAQKKKMEMKNETARRKEDVRKEEDRKMKEMIETAKAKKDLMEAAKSREEMSTQAPKTRMQLMEDQKSKKQFMEGATAKSKKEMVQQATKKPKLGGSVGVSGVAASRGNVGNGGNRLLGVREPVDDDPGRNSPDAWSKADDIRKLSLQQVEEKAKRQQELRRRADERGKVALKKAALEKKYTSLKNKLMDGEGKEAESAMGTGQQVSMLGLDTGPPVDDLFSEMSDSDIESEAELAESSDPNPKTPGSSRKKEMKKRNKKRIPDPPFATKFEAEKTQGAEEPKIVPQQRGEAARKAGMDAQKKKMDVKNETPRRKEEDQKMKEMNEAAKSTNVTQASKTKQLVDDAKSRNQGGPAKSKKEMVQQQAAKKPKLIASVGRGGSGGGVATSDDIRKGEEGVSADTGPPVDELFSEMSDSDIESEAELAESSDPNPKTPGSGRKKEMKKRDEKIIPSPPFATKLREAEAEKKQRTEEPKIVVQQTGEPANKANLDAQKKKMQVKNETALQKEDVRKEEDRKMNEPAKSRKDMTQAPKTKQLMEDEKSKTQGAATAKSKKEIVQQSPKKPKPGKSAMGTGQQQVSNAGPPVDDPFSEMSDSDMESEEDNTTKLTKLKIPEKLAEPHSPTSPGGEMMLKTPSSSKTVGVDVNQKDLMLHTIVSGFLARRVESIELLPVSSSSFSDLHVDSTLMTRSPTSSSPAATTTTTTNTTNDGPNNTDLNMSSINTTLNDTPSDSSYAKLVKLLAVPGKPTEPDGPYTSTPGGEMMLKTPTSSRTVGVAVSRKDLMLHAIVSGFLTRRVESIEMLPVSSSSSSDLRVDSTLVTRSPTTSPSSSFPAATTSPSSSAATTSQTSSPAATNTTTNTMNNTNTGSSSSPAATPSPPPHNKNINKKKEVKRSALRNFVGPEMGDSTEFFSPICPPRLFRPGTAGAEIPESPSTSPSFRNAAGKQEDIVASIFDQLQFDFAGLMSIERPPWSYSLV